MGIRDYKNNIDTNRANGEVFKTGTGRAFQKRRQINANHRIKEVDQVERAWDERM